MMVAMTAASRWANAVASAGTRAIAPPRTRSWTIVVGELGAAIASSIASIASSSSVLRKRDRWTASERCSASRRSARRCPGTASASPCRRAASRRRGTAGARPGRRPDRRHHTNMMTSDIVPTSSAGTNGAGGSAIRNEIVRQLLGRARRDRHEAAQDVPGRRHEQRAAEDLADRVELELEAGDDAEVAAAAAHRPEQVRVRVLAGGDLAAVGRDDLDRHERIDGQAVLAHQPADPATERQAGDADRARVAERRREPVGGRGVRVLARRSGRAAPRRRGGRDRCGGPSSRRGRGRCRRRSCRSRRGCGRRRGPTASRPDSRARSTVRATSAASAARTMSAGRAVVDRVWTWRASS